VTHKSGSVGAVGGKPPAATRRGAKRNQRHLLQVGLRAATPESAVAPAHALVRSEALASLEVLGPRTRSS